MPARVGAANDVLERVEEMFALLRLARLAEGSATKEGDWGVRAPAARRAFGEGLPSLVAAWQQPLTTFLSTIREKVGGPPRSA